MPRTINQSFKTTITLANNDLETQNHRHELLLKGMRTFEAYFLNLSVRTNDEIYKHLFECLNDNDLNSAIQLIKVKKSAAKYQIANSV